MPYREREIRERIKIALSDTLYQYSAPISDVSHLLSLLDTTPGQANAPCPKSTDGQHLWDHYLLKDRPITACAQCGTPR